MAYRISRRPTAISSIYGNRFSENFADRLLSRPGLLIFENIEPQHLPRNRVAKQQNQRPPRRYRFYLVSVSWNEPRPRKG